MIKLSFTDDVITLTGFVTLFIGLVLTIVHPLFIFLTLLGLVGVYLPIALADLNR